MNKAIEIQDKAQCCGCSACFAACPVDAIEMQADAEGFKYPVVDAARCIDCGKCRQTCPLINRAAEEEKPQRVFLAQHRDAAIRQHSTSGGAFTALAQVVLSRGGIVYGAVYDDQLRVVHRAIERPEDLRLLQGSKYVQSDMQATFRAIKAHQQAGRLVLFSGTPCQIEGLRLYLWITKSVFFIDLVCRAVPSPKVWSKYKKSNKFSKTEGTADVRFRDKRYYGYTYAQIVGEDAAGQATYHAGIDSDPMLRAFFSNICDRPSCYQCAFKKRYRVSDLTLWDCFDVGLYDKTFDDNRGTTSILVHSEQGLRLLEAASGKKLTQNPVGEPLPASTFGVGAEQSEAEGVVPPSATSLLRLRELPDDRLPRSAHEMTHSVPMNPRRAAFMADLDTMEPRALFDKWFPQTWKNRTARLARILLARTGLYNKVKRAVKRGR